jgi:hypothetical protein
MNIRKPSDTNKAIISVIPDTIFKVKLTNVVFEKFNMFFYNKNRRFKTNQCCA